MLLPCALQAVCLTGFQNSVIINFHKFNCTGEVKSILTPPAQFALKGDAIQSEHSRTLENFILTDGGQNLSRRRKPVNSTSIPQYEIEATARCIMPDILAFYESEEGQREFAEWKKRRENEEQEVKAG